MPTGRFIRVAAFAALTNPLFLISAAHAQWTVTVLNPTGAASSFAYGVSGGQQVGTSLLAGVDRASLWSGTADSWVDLSPAGATSSTAFGVSGEQQVGEAWIGGVARASLWSGTAASWMDLSPAGATSSRAQGIGGGQQVGSAMLDGIHRASLWAGTAASRVDLHPAGSTLSRAFDTNGTQQVGFAIFNGWHRASLWSGTAASWVDLSPVGSEYSYAHAIDGDQQVGLVSMGWERASLWRGTSASWVDLTPPAHPYATSRARDAFGGQQVGYAFVNDQVRASLWSGSGASWVDLSVYLPADYIQSEAFGISSDGFNIHITGFGHRGGGVSEAWMLTRPVPEPETWLLMLIGAGLIARQARRQRKAGETGFRTSERATTAHADRPPRARLEPGASGNGVQSIESLHRMPARRACAAWVHVG